MQNINLPTFASPTVFVCVRSSEMTYITPALTARVRQPSLLKKVMKPQDTLPFFKDGQYIGWSGFTGVGYPKMIPVALADHVEKHNLQGQMKFNLFVGASSGADTEVSF
jgi:acetyl-CoA hydrolase